MLFRRLGSSFAVVFLFDPHRADAVLKAQTPFLLEEVPLTLRGSPTSLVRGFPAIGAVHHWRKSANSRRAPNVDRSAARLPTPDELGREVLLELPKNWKDRWTGDSAPSGGMRVKRDGCGGDGEPARLRRQFDPMKLINAVAFAVHLKSTAEFSDAMDSAATYDADPNQPPPPRDRSKDVSDRHLRRKKEHLDVVGMLLQRRTFHSEVASDTVDCLNVYSDASPVVGKEIQGMVVDFTHKDGSVRRVVLPGASLAYGNYDATNKTICLIHALWLICGPDAFHLRRACELVTSLTTDFGVEMNIANVPDCIDAYLEFMDGAELSTLRSKVKFGRHPFPNALRIAGWNHTISSIMKTVMKSCEQYPEHLASMRTMCAFCNCVAYLDHLAKVLAPKAPNAAKLPKKVFQLRSLSGDTRH